MGTTSSAYARPPKPTPDTITVFTQGTIISDLHYHNNKQLLFTLSSPPELYMLKSHVLEDPDAATLIHRFGGERTCHAIGKLGAEMYVVLTSQAEWTSDNTFCEMKAGTSALWKVDLARWTKECGGAVIEKLADFPSAGLLTRVIAIPIANSTVLPSCLLTDSMSGSILHFDPNTKTHSTWFSHSSMFSTSTGIPRPFGVAGIEYYDSYIYYTNVSTSTLHRVRLSPSTLQPDLSSVELVAKTSMRKIRSKPHPCVDIQIHPHEISKIPIAYMAGEMGVIKVQLQGHNKGKVEYAESTFHDLDFRYVTCVVLGQGEGGKMKDGKFRRGAFIWVGARNIVVDGGWRTMPGKKFWGGSRVLREYVGYFP